MRGSRGCQIAREGPGPSISGRPTSSFVAQTHLLQLLPSPPPSCFLPTFSHVVEEDEFEFRSLAIGEENAYQVLEGWSQDSGGSSRGKMRGYIFMNEMEIRRFGEVVGENIWIFIID